MRNQLTIFFLFLLLTFPGAVWAENQPRPDAAVKSANDEKVVAVLDILELMEMVQEDIPMLKDMEYLMEVDSDEPQK